jgi:hypothetical protein
MWALYSSISELPPLIRNSRKNIIVHCLWTGSLNINIVLEKYNKKTDDLFSNGLEIDKFKGRILIRMIGLLCDTIGRPKVCNSTQFNGAYGCLHCLHPHKITYKDGKTLWCYNYDPLIKDRTNLDYQSAANAAELAHNRVNGIRG